jgi:uncharacterized membrane protein YgcG
LVVALIVAGVIGAVWIKVRVEAGLSLAQAQALEAQQELELAIVCYRRTVRWYSPASGPVKTALARLWSLGQSQEKEGHIGLALLAYRSIRSALYGIRSVYQPHADKIPAASQRIAALMAGQEGAQTGTDRHQERVAHQLALLGVDHSPDVGWSLLAVLAFLAWCWSLYSLAIHAFDDKSGALIADAAVRRGAVVAVTLMTWMLALWQA